VVTVTAGQCEDMLNEFMFPQLGFRDSDTDIILFQEDGAISRTAQQPMNSLRKVFRNKIIPLLRDHFAQPIPSICRYVI
jgi:hypothetical protein